MYLVCCHAINESIITQYLQGGQCLNLFGGRIRKVRDDQPLFKRDNWLRSKSYGCNVLTVPKQMQFSTIPLTMYPQVQYFYPGNVP